MTEAKHTPGPWAYVPMLTASENHKGYFVRAANPARGFWALATVQPGDTDGALGLANARLIAAAPDLLAALVVLVEEKADYMRRNPEREHAIKMARAAIAMATGGTA